MVTSNGVSVHTVAKQVQFDVDYMTCFFLCACRGPSGRRQNHHEISWLGPRSRSFTKRSVKPEPRNRIEGRIRQNWILYLALREK